MPRLWIGDVIIHRVQCFPPQLSIKTRICGCGLNLEQTPYPRPSVHRLEATVVGCVGRRLFYYVHTIDLCFFFV